MSMKGISLIEVLVASFILATGVLVLISLQASAVGIGIVSGHRQQASLLLMELAELSHISPGTFREIAPESFFAAEPAQTCVEGSICDPAVFIQQELYGWAVSVRKTLPDASIEISQTWHNEQLIWTVRLSWHGAQEFSQNSLQTELVL